MEKQEQDERIKAREQRWKDLVPSRFRDCSFDNYIPKNKNQKAALNSMLANPKGSYFIVGAYGSGKTHLLYAQLRQYIFSEKPCGAYAIRTTAELNHEIRQHEMGNGSCYPLQRVRDGAKFHMLWDDADKIKVTDFKMEGIFELIDGLYRHEMGLSITSNFDLKDGLQEKLSPAICRRIDDLCTKIEL